MSKDNNNTVIPNEDDFVIQKLTNPYSAANAHNDIITMIQKSDSKNKRYTKFNSKFYGGEKCDHTCFSKEMQVYKAQQKIVENKVENKATDKAKDKYNYSFCTTSNINNFHIIQNTQVTKVNAVEIGNLLSTGKFMGRRLLTEILNLEELKNVRYMYAKIHQENQKCIELFESLNFKKQNTTNSKNNFETYVLDREAQENDTSKNENKNFANKNAYDKSKKEKTFSKDKSSRFINF